MCLSAIAAAVIGCGIGYVLRKHIAEARIGSAEEKANRILDDAKKAIENAMREAENLKKKRWFRHVRKSIS